MTNPMKPSRLSSRINALFSNKEVKEANSSEDFVPKAVLQNRMAVGSIFFLHGLCFASWASRIPSIQEILGLSPSELGGVLFALPLGFFISLPFAGWLIGKLGSRRVVIPSAFLYSIALLFIGSSTDVLRLTVALFCFGFFANILNISINTQAAAVEALYKKKD